MSLFEESTHDQSRSDTAANIPSIDDPIFDAPLDIIVDPQPVTTYGRLLQAAFPHDAARRKAWQRFELCGKYFTLQKCENGHITKTHGSRCMLRTCPKCGAAMAEEQYSKYKTLARTHFQWFTTLRMFFESPEKAYAAMPKLRRLLPSAGVPTLAKVGCPGNTWAVKLVHLAEIPEAGLVFLRSAFPGVVVTLLPKDKFIEELRALVHDDLPRDYDRLIQFEIASRGKRQLTFWGLDHQARKKQFVKEPDNTDKKRVVSAFRAAGIPMCAQCGAEIVASTQTLTELTPSTNLKWKNHARPNYDHLLPKDDCGLPIHLNC